MCKQGPPLFTIPLKWLNLSGRMNTRLSRSSQNSHPKCGGAATQQVPHNLLLLFLNLLGKQAVTYSSPEGPNAPRKYKKEARQTDPRLPSWLAFEPEHDTSVFYPTWCLNV